MQIKCTCTKCKLKPSLTIKQIKNMTCGQYAKWLGVKDYAVFLSHNYDYNGEYHDNIELANLSIKNKLQMHSLIK